jgi:hypothetical protein
MSSLGTIFSNEDVRDVLGLILERSTPQTKLTLRQVNKYMKSKLGDATEDIAFVKAEEYKKLKQLFLDLHKIKFDLLQEIRETNDRRLINDLLKDVMQIQLEIDDMKKRLDQFKK